MGCSDSPYAPFELWSSERKIRVAEELIVRMSGSLLYSDEDPGPMTGEQLTYWLISMVTRRWNREC